MNIQIENGIYHLLKEGERIGQCPVAPTPEGAALGELCIQPRWQRHGYGTYLLREILRGTGGFSTELPSLHTAPLPADAALLPFWQRQGFVPAQGHLERRREPDLTAVRFSHELLAARLTAPALCVDATCGNGGDTLFLCRLCAQRGAEGWRVLAMDIQPQAVRRTETRLAQNGFAPPQAVVLQGDHAALLAGLAPESADAILFNLGWLPGADHNVYSTADTTLPALEAALRALKPGGVLSVVLYSGKTIGCSERDAVLEWLRALPLSRCTVLECRFANWADTAPLPCLVIKKRQP